MLRLVFQLIILVFYQSSISFTNANLLPNTYRIVRTLNGDVRGTLNTTALNGKFYYSFLGIPFAEPPIGQLRFKHPIPVRNWSGVKDAFKLGTECLQKNDEIISGNEDCLYLSVYVPEIESNELLPVMVYIHGGAYLSGTGNGHGPDFLLNHNVIMVSIHYRLNILGFMSLGMPKYSGNMGLKDQLLALKWINRNIEFFGGDKLRITIFGESAGSASIHFHTLSPKSHGLFKRAILQSGTALNPWTLYRENDHLHTLMEFGKQFGNITDSTEELIEYLMNVNGELLVSELIRTFYVPGTARKSSNLEWAPVVESKNALEPFLTEYPEDILERHSETDIDMLMGFNSAEMLTLSIYDILDPDQLAPFDEHFELSLPRAHLKYDFNSKEYRQMVRDIRKFYFPRNATVGKETLTEFIRMLSDVWFVFGIVDSSRLQYYHSSGRTYLYQLSVESDLNMLKAFHGIDLKELNLHGTAHADDKLYLFFFDNIDYTKFSKDSVEMKSVKLVTQLWTNFAKYGSPTLSTDLVQFKAIENGTVNYGDITNYGLVPGINPFERNIQFWDNFYVKYQNVFNFTKIN